MEHCSVGICDKRSLDGSFILHLRYDYQLSYEEAEEKLGIQRPSIQLMQDRLRWTGHALRSDDTVLQEVLLFVPMVEHEVTEGRVGGSTIL